MKPELMELVKHRRQITREDINNGSIRLVVTDEDDKEHTITVPVEAIDAIPVCAEIYKQKGDPCPRKLGGHKICEGCTAY